MRYPDLYLPEIGDLTEAIRARTPPVQSWVEDAVLFSEGEVADAIFVVAAGTIRTCKFFSEGRRQIIGFHGAGGLIGVSLGEQYRHSAEAVSSTQAYRIGRVELSRILEAQPQFVYSLALVVERELVAAQRHILRLGRMTAQERLCSFILEHLGDNTSFIDLPMLRMDVADYLGLTIETVSRTMTKLRDDGVIRTPTQSSIEVIDRDRLTKVSGTLNAGNLHALSSQRII